MKKAYSCKQRLTPNLEIGCEGKSEVGDGREDERSEDASGQRTTQNGQSDINAYITSIGSHCSSPLTTPSLSGAAFSQLKIHHGSKNWANSPTKRRKALPVTFDLKGRRVLARKSSKIRKKVWLDKM